MSGKAGRIFAGFFAALFLVTSSAFVIVTIISAMTQNNNTNDSSSKEKAQQTQQQTPKNKLEGTKLSGFTPVAKVSSLQETDIKKGTGATVKPGDSITVDYTGAIADTGMIFQSTKDFGQPASFSLSGVIAGWSQGIPGMKVGGTRRLLIPSVLAYADKPPQGSNIPPNANLVFDVTVEKITKQ